MNNVTAWLAERNGRRLEPSLWSLALLVTAARAGLLLESLEAGEPELTLTARATLEALAATGHASRSLADAAWESFEEVAVSWGAPPAPLLAELREAVEGLPAYSDEAAAPAIAA